MDPSLPFQTHHIHTHSHRRTLCPALIRGLKGGEEGGQQRLAGFTHMGSKVLLSQDFSASKFSMIILTTIQSGPSPASPEQQWQRSVAAAARARGPSQERGRDRSNDS